MKNRSSLAKLTYQNADTKMKKFPARDGVRSGAWCGVLFRMNLFGAWEMSCNWESCCVAASRYWTGKLTRNAICSSQELNL